QEGRMKAPPSLWRPEDGIGVLEEVLSRGGIIAFPTESSYAYGVDPRNPEGVERVYVAKGRPASKALPVVVASVGDLECLGVAPALEAIAQLARIWPAPLTAVLPTTEDLPAAAGTGGIAVRIPAHAGLRRLLTELGPLTATSANPSGEEPALTAQQARAYLEGEDAVIVDGPALPGGPASTLIRWDGGAWQVLREGAFPPVELKRLLVLRKEACP
ncbi:MAG: L-threonylcarbamoyladenylate synthase, partial [Acidobacteria bacterium]|nr:L-threonylcarbamoyladenylate synthase [Acidobacteriota bacterium]